MDGVILVIPSVMHTGTHLLLDIFKNWNKISPIPDSMFYPPMDNKDHIIQFHLIDGHSTFYEIAETYHQVIPMRHPVRVLESMRRRQKTLADLEEQFANLIRVHEWAPMYIHVDSKDRDKHVQAVAKLINRPLSTDWPNLSHKGTIDFEVTDERIVEIPQWIMEFYDTIVGNQRKTHRVSIL